MDKNRKLAQDLAFRDLIVSCYPWEIEHFLDLWCAQSDYWSVLEPIDRLIDEVEIGKRKPNSIVAAINSVSRF
jgi:hypothetical protein